MALADILNRIEGDAVSEAQVLVDAAEAEAARLLDEARESAEAEAARTLGAAERDAERDAATLLAATRLRARDEALAARRALIDRAIAGLEAAIVALSDAEYEAFLAKAVAGVGRGGERVLVADADRGRLGGLEGAVRLLRADLALGYGETTGEIAHGVMLTGEREVVDLSVAGIIDSQRETLVMRLARTLFGEGDSA